MNQHRLLQSLNQRGWERRVAPRCGAGLRRVRSPFSREEWWAWWAWSRSLEGSVSFCSPFAFGRTAVGMTLVWRGGRWRCLSWLFRRSPGRLVTVKSVRVVRLNLLFLEDRVHGFSRRTRRLSTRRVWGTRGFCCEGRDGRCWRATLVRCPLLRYVERAWFLLGRFLGFFVLASNRIICSVEMDPSFCRIVWRKLIFIYYLFS